MFTIEFWDSLFLDPEFASKISGNIISGFIIGLFTLLAALILISLYVYFSRKSRQNSQDFLLWISNSNAKFQNNDSYKNTREAIAEYRSIIFLYVAMELYLTSTIHLNTNKDFSKYGIELFLLKTFSNSDDISKFNINLPLKYFEYSELGIKHWKYKFNWSFIRKFTDYLRFYEETLLACEELSNIGNKKRASTLINNYYWHMQSIIFG